jgi:hypothetical protein
MHFTDYHAKYFAHELTKRCASDSMEKLAGALVDAQVDLNPHQVDAALFSFKSPLSKGAILADEVGLGKTIEAGLVLSQRWAERKRRLLVITPANLRKQWYQDLQEKFFLPCRILESKSYNAEAKQGNPRPFHAEDIIICSYEFARRKAEEISATCWDLVVIDEAHRLRNVYKSSNIIANTLQQALKDVPKLLLTSTPLQNSLLELYGLVSFVDERTFGDLKSFREQFAHLSNARVFQTLKARLQPICKRTLRRNTRNPHATRSCTLHAHRPGGSPTWQSRRERRRGLDYCARRYGPCPWSEPGHQHPRSHGARRDRGFTRGWRCHAARRFGWLCAVHHLRILSHVRWGPAGQRHLHPGNGCSSGSRRRAVGSYTVEGLIDFVGYSHTIVVITGALARGCRDSPRPRAPLPSRASAQWLGGRVGCQQTRRGGWA